ncbi:head-tail adaptor protein [Clostridium botulinum]|uniref:phage head closure protein n=1 Tax=Clostridium botulinum TaxID=1491 RepID=UPI0013FEB9D0|nr:phage head closure protein [Clostridium botulinum]MBY6837848.1 phage head closure protein [Clostridium botulinum]NFG65914.1 head-tail adaptor protein [Clostridium botulinum]NFQ24725.1 head-tail adaptor protein [Clostridium botulinum]
MKIINSGEFKHPIRIERFVTGVDEDNIPTEEWKDIIPNKVFRAKIKNTSGYEKIIGQADTSIDKKRFYIRYKKDLNLTTKDRIVYNKNIYNITYASDIEELHKYYEIVAELVQ